ncbi:MAG: alpha/beta fold hydrolase [Oscillospiraceae bacterium]|jgi:carboxylesterase|nr:alpha/beta fold hydrolase [Oscillospiraceae bacterium]
MGTDFTGEKAKPFLLPGGDAGILLLHGFTGTPGHMRPLGDALCAAGYTVAAPLLPGHGTRVQDVRAHGGYAPWLNAALAAYDDLAARCGRVAVGGLSMGGVLSLLLAQRRQPFAVLTFAAPMRLRNPLAYAAPLLGWAVPYVRKRHKKRGADFLRDYDIGYAHTPLCRMGDLLRLIGDARRGLPQVRCPLLVAQGLGDEQVRPESARIIYDGAASGQKELLWLQKSGHVCTLGPDRETLFAACAAFLANAPR